MKTMGLANMAITITYEKIIITIQNNFGSAERLSVVRTSFAASNFAMAGSFFGDLLRQIAIELLAFK